MQKCKEFIQKHIELFLALVKIAIFTLAILISFKFILGLTTMDSDYMVPNVKYHDNVIYSRYYNTYALRDVVVYEYNGETYIGRVVGMPGYTVTTNSNGNVFQNGNLVYEDDVKFTSNRSIEVEYTLSDDQYFIICDDRSQNFDSRQFGPISEDDIDGKVLLILRRYGI